MTLILISVLHLILLSKFCTSTLLKNGYTNVFSFFLTGKRLNDMKEENLFPESNFLFKITKKCFVNSAIQSKCSSQLRWKGRGGGGGVVPFVTFSKKVNIIVPLPPIQVFDALTRNYHLGGVLTTHRLAYLCCQCDASLDVKLALLVVARSEQ